MASISTRTLSADAANVDVAQTTSYPLRSLVDWQAIIAGGVIAAGVSFLLMSFGSAVGFSIASPFTNEGASVTTIGSLAILWFAFTQLYSFAVGGYVAGRLRAPAGDGADRDEIQFRDGISGLVVWAAALILSALMVATTAASLTGLAASGASQAVNSGASAVSEQLPSSDYLTDMFLRSSAPTAAPQTEAQGNRGDARAEIGRILSMGAIRGELTSDDRQNLAAIVAARSATSQEEAVTRVNEAITKVDAAREDITRRAKVIADDARAITAQAAFWATVIMLLTGMLTWYAAKLGGRHRDERTFY